MQMNKEFNKENDTMAAIGIGAMIVFIALILVAAVASAVIIQTGEKLQQNAQETGDDTQNSMRGKVKIVGAYKTNGPVYNFILVASPGSSDIDEADILFQMHCGSSSETIAGDDAAAAMTTISGTAASTITTDEGYIMAITPGVTACQSGEITLHIHVKGMGTTYETFDASVANGESLI